MKAAARKFRFEEERTDGLVVLPICEFCEEVTEVLSKRIGRAYHKICNSCLEQLVGVPERKPYLLDPIDEMWKSWERSVKDKRVAKQWVNNGLPDTSGCYYTVQSQITGNATNVPVGNNYTLTTGKLVSSTSFNVTAKANIVNFDADLYALKLSYETGGV